MNLRYLEKGQLRVETLGRGFAWLDTGTPEAMADAGNFVRALETRQSVRISCPEEIACEMGFITPEDLRKLGEDLGKSEYGRYLQVVADAKISERAGG